MQRSRFYIQRKDGTRWARYSPQRGYHENIEPAELLVIAEPGLYRARYVSESGTLLSYGEIIPVSEREPELAPEKPTPEESDTEPDTEPNPPPPEETDPAAVPFPRPDDGELMRFMWMYKLIREDIKADNATFLQLMSQQMNVALLAEQTRARESLELASTHHKAVAKAQQEMVQEMRSRSLESEKKAEQANKALVQVMQDQDDEQQAQLQHQPPADPKAALIEQLPMLLAAAKEMGIIGA